MSRLNKEAQQGEIGADKDAEHHDKKLDKKAQGNHDSGKDEDVEEEEEEDVEEEDVEEEDVDQEKDDDDSELTKLLDKCKIGDVPAYEPGMTFFVPTIPAAIAKSIRDRVKSFTGVDKYKRVIELLGTLRILYQPIFFDRIKSDLLEGFVNRLSLLDSGQLMGNWCNSLLVGMKGVGKSSFLQAIVVAHQILGERTTCIYYSRNKRLEHCENLPSAVIANSCPLDIGSEFRISDVIATLKKERRAVFMVIDEYQANFCLPESEGIPFHDEVYAIGNSVQGTIFLILSGSAANLRDLCFTHIDIDTATYPSYRKGTSLNSQRFAATYLMSLQRKEEFRFCLDHLLWQESTPDGVKVTIRKVLLDDDRLCSIFLACGGRYRPLAKALSLEEFNSNNGSGAESLEGQAYSTVKLFEIYGPLWRLLFEYIQKQFIGTFDTRFHDPFAAFFSVKKHAIDLASIGYTTKKLYQAADNDAIILSVDPVTGEYLLSFSHPFHLQYMRYRQKDNASMTFEQQIWLRYPYGILGIKAEALVLESLAAKSFVVGAATFQERSLSVTLSDKTRHEHYVHSVQKQIPFVFLSLTTKSQGVTTGPQVDPYLSVVGEYLKPHPDQFGCDAILLMHHTEKTVTVYRIQIKLGVSVITASKASKIKDRFSSKQARLKRFLTTAGIPRLVFRDLLITTRPISEDALQSLSVNKIKPFSREQMKKFWSDKIAAWDQSIGLSIYS